MRSTEQEAIKNRGLIPYFYLYDDENNKSIIIRVIPNDKANNLIGPSKCKLARIKIITLQKQVSHIKDLAL